VVPDPDPDQLASIAIASADTHLKLTGDTPVVAMLSFSTYGSASHPKVDKVREATRLVKERAPTLAADGELQGDSALVPSVGLKKAPGSKVAGKANVLIFPDLDSGNIGYKLTQRLANAIALGPLIQGLKKPAMDLSRGCTAEDIMNVAAICCVLSG
jgi:phosphate acetyltransferase